MICPQSFILIKPAPPKLSVCNLPSLNVPPNPPLKHEHSSQTDFCQPHKPPQPINIPPLQPCGPQKPALSQPYPVRQPIPNIRNYHQHQLTDGEREKTPGKRSNYSEVG